MPKKYVDMKSFGPEQAERIGIFRRLHFAVQRPAKPRHLPDFKDACVLIDHGSNDRRLGRRLNGDLTAMSNGLIKKLHGFGLMDTYAELDEMGRTVQAYLLNAHGMELFIRGNVDVTVPASETAKRYYEKILKSRDRRQTLPNGLDLKERNSTIDIDRIGFETDAATIGVFLGSPGFMAMAYDSHGVRITDVFIQNFEPEDREWKWNMIQDQDEYPIKRDDLQPALHLAKLLNVPEEKIFFDEKLASDIWDGKSFDYKGRICVSPDLNKTHSLQRRTGYPMR
jgi:hypothetical protein